MSKFISDMINRYNNKTSQDDDDSEEENFEEEANDLDELEGQDNSIPLKVIETKRGQKYLLDEAQGNNYVMGAYKLYNIEETTPHLFHIGYMYEVEGEGTLLYDGLESVIVMKMRTSDDIYYVCIETHTIYKIREDGKLEKYGVKHQL